MLTLLVAAAIGAAIGDRAASATARACPARPPVTERRITSPRWVSGAVVTEYYPIRESWFAGRVVRVRGLPGRHRVDWLFGPHGLAMNGEGLGRDGRFYHFAGSYGIGWVNEAGAATRPCWNGAWTGGRPAWLAFGWRHRRGRRTRSVPAVGQTDVRRATCRRPCSSAFAPVGRARFLSGTPSPPIPV